MGKWFLVLCVFLRTHNRNRIGSEREREWSHSAIRIFMWKKWCMLQPWVHSSCILRRARVLVPTKFHCWLTFCYCVCTAFHHIHSVNWALSGKRIYTKQFNNSLFSHRFCASFAKSIFVRCFAVCMADAMTESPFLKSITICERIDPKNCTCNRDDVAVAAVARLISIFGMQPEWNNNNNNSNRERTLSG